MRTLARILGSLAVVATAAAGLSIRDGWGADVFAYVLLALLLGGCGKALAEQAERVRQSREDQEAEDTSTPFVLLLRPFWVDRALATSDPHHSQNVLNPQFYYSDKDILVHRVLRRAVEPKLRVVVFGGDATGAGRIVVQNWRPVFEERAASACAIVVIAMPGEATLWECEQIKLKGWLEKTAFLVPPFPGNGDSAREAFHKSLGLAGLEIPSDPKDYTLAYLDRHGRVVAHYEMLADLSHRTLLKALNLTVFRREREGCDR